MAAECAQQHKVIGLDALVATGLETVQRGLIVDGIGLAPGAGGAGQARYDALDGLATFVGHLGNQTCERGGIFHVGLDQLGALEGIGVSRSAIGRGCDVRGISNEGDSVVALLDALGYDRPADIPGGAGNQDRSGRFVLVALLILVRLGICNIDKEWLG